MSQTPLLMGRIVGRMFRLSLTARKFALPLLLLLLNVLLLNATVQASGALPSVREVQHERTVTGPGLSPPSVTGSIDYSRSSARHGYFGPWTHGEERQEVRDRVLFHENGAVWRQGSREDSRPGERQQRCETIENLTICR